MSHNHVSAFKKKKYNSKKNKKQLYDSGVLLGSETMQWVGQGVAKRYWKP